jgi:hypothetical protein
VKKKEKKDSEGLTEQLLQVLRAEYAVLDGNGEIAVDEVLLASRAMTRVDPEKRSPSLSAWAATLELRQLGRAICRQSSGLDDPQNAGQSELFAGLQRRYPALRDEKEVYVLREHLTLAERKANIARLRSEATSKLAHARALESETEELIKLGLLDEDEAA